MKKLKYIFSLAVLVLVAAFASCAKDKDYEPAQPETNPIQAYIYADTEREITYTPADEQSLEVQIGRRDTKDAACLPIQIMDEDSTIWTDTVRFEAGESSSILTIQTDLELEESMTLTITIPDQYKTAYGPQSMDITLSVDYSWIDAGMADFYSEWEDAEGTLVVQQAKEYTDEAGNLLYRIVSPYYNLAPDYCTVPGLHLQFLLDKDGNAVDIPGGPELYVEDTGCWMFWDPASYPDDESFTNEGNVYSLQVMWCDDDGLYDPTTETWTWNKNEYE